MNIVGFAPMKMLVLTTVALLFVLALSIDKVFTLVALQDDELSHRSHDVTLPS